MLKTQDRIFSINPDKPTAHLSFYAIQNHEESENTELSAEMFSLFGNLAFKAKCSGFIKDVNYSGTVFRTFYPTGIIDVQIAPKSDIMRLIENRKNVGSTSKNATHVYYIWDSDDCQRLPKFDTDFQHGDILQVESETLVIISVLNNGKVLLLNVKENQQDPDKGLKLFELSDVRDIATFGSGVFRMRNFCKVRNNQED